MKKSARLLSLAALGLALAQPVAAKTLLTVNNTPIDSSEIDAQVKLLQEQSNHQIPDTPEVRQRILQQRVTQELIIQDAHAKGWDKESQYVAVLNKARADADAKGVSKQAGFAEDWNTFKNNLLVEYYLSKIINDHPVTDSDVQNAYNTLKNKYNGTEEVQLAGIFTQDQATNTKALAELQAGKAFATVAKTYSVDPAAKTTGGLNPNFLSLVDIQETSPEFYAAIKDLPIGKYTTTPLHMGNVNAIFQLKAKRKIQVPAYAKMRPNVQAQLQNNAIDNVIRSLYQKATIK